MALIPTRAIPSGLGVRGQRELVGAVIPGTLVLIEIWLLVLSPQHAHRRGGYLKLASRGTELLRDFEREHGRAPVERALARHDALRHALACNEHDAFFQYAKLWLRRGHGSRSRTTRPRSTS